MSDHAPPPSPPTPEPAPGSTPRPAGEPASTDVVLRALTDEGSLRVVVVALDAAASAPIGLHARSEREAAAFGELLAAATLVRETVAPGLRIQMTLRGERGGYMMADSFPDGLVRGFIARPAAGPEGEGGAGPAELALGPASVLQVSRQMPGGRLHQSVVPVGAEDPGSGRSVVAAAVESYLQSSEQITASSDLAAFRGEGAAPWRVRARLVQVMPGADREVVARVTERLEGLGEGAERRAALDAPPAALVGAALGDAPHTIVSEERLHHGCLCSEDKVLAALATLGGADLRALVEAGEEVELSCDYCTKTYRFPAAKVAGLLASPGEG